jgi:F0F1-type ATP synthase assembly protein I
VSQGNQQFEQNARMAGLVGQIGCMTSLVSVVIIAIAFGVGRLLDSLLNTQGLFTVLLLLGSFPMTLYAIVRVAMYSLAKVQQGASRPAGENTEPFSEEESQT